MSSLATKQQITMLSIVGFCLELIVKENTISVVKLKEMVKSTYRKVGDAIEDWPGVDTGNDGRWIYTRIMQWDQILAKRQKEFCRLPMLAATASNCFADLTEITKSREKLILLEGIQEPLDKLLNFCDPKGVNFPAYEGADFLLKNLYELIGLKR